MRRGLPPLVSSMPPGSGVLARVRMEHCPHRHDEDIELFEIG